MTVFKGKISLFNRKSDKRFLNMRNLDLWVHPSIYKDLNDKTLSIDSVPIVRLFSEETANRFSIFCGIQELNTIIDSFTEDHFLISDNISYKQAIIEDGIKVSIEAIKTDSFVEEAGTITIKLNSEEVILWSKDEENFAKNSFLAQNKFTYGNQVQWIKPGQEGWQTIGEIIDIKPNSEKSDELYQLTSDTKIVFSGLPEKKQKVVDFSKIGGLGNVIRNIREIIQIPLEYPELFSKFDIQAPKGILLHGPPGNGKTLIAKAISQSLGANFHSLSGPNIFKPIVGQGEAVLKKTFDKARRDGKSVIFIDEIDAITQNRETTNAEHVVSLVNQLLALMDGTETDRKVLVIGATNRLSVIDPALRRPGRFGLEFEIPVPDKNNRLDILSKYFDLDKSDNFDTSISSDFLNDIAEMTNGYSGADLYDLYRRSIFQQMRQNLEYEEDTGKIFIRDGVEISTMNIHSDNVLRAMKEITPSIMKGKIQNTSYQKEWDGILGMDDFKKLLVKINSDLEELITSDSILHRPLQSNMSFIGSDETDKKTLAQSFAKRFGYEFIELDLLHESLDGSSEGTLSVVIRVIQKAKQIAPSILYLNNIDTSQNPQRILGLLYERLNNLPSKSKVILILSLPDSKKDLPFIRNSFDFNSLYRDNGLVQQLSQKLHTSINGLESFEDIGKILMKNRSISMTVRELQEKQILAS